MHLASALQSSVLPTPVGPRKMNEPSGRGRVVQARHGSGGWRSATACTACSCPTIMLVQRLLQVQQPLALRLGEAGRVDAGDVRHKLRDVLGGDRFLKASVPDCRSQSLLRLLQTRAAGRSLRSRMLAAHSKSWVLMAVILLDLEGVRASSPASRRSVRDCNGVHPHTRAGLVDQVDGLVGQAAVGDIPRGQRHGRFDGLVE